MKDKDILALVEFMVAVDEDPSGEKAQKIVGDIYTVVHSHRKEHSCHYVHKDWRKSAKEWFKQLPKDFI